MKLKNKILIITLIFVAIILLFKLDCFALENVPTTQYSEEFSRTTFTNLSTAQEKLDYIKRMPFYSKESDNLKYIFMANSYYTTYLMVSDYPFKVDKLNKDSATSYFSSIGTCHMYSINFQEESKWYSIKVANNSEYSNSLFNGKMGSSTMMSSLSINHDLLFSDKGNGTGVAIAREDCKQPFPLITPTLQEVLEKGYQTAQETTTQSITAQLVEILPVGIVIMATLILVSLIAYFRFWKQ